MEKDKRFDEGFDNILIYDYDTEYQQGAQITADSLMESGGRGGQSLDGAWHFCPDVFHSVVRGRWFEEIRYNRNQLPIPYDFSFDEWETIQVPGVWNDQKKEYALYEGSGLYFKEFQCDRETNSRVILRVGAANYETRIWLNKKYLGRHLGGFTPFSVDITDFMEGTNRLILSVDNTRKGQQIPSLHYDWFNYGGIHRSVELIKVPQVYIKNFCIQLSKENQNQMDWNFTVVSNEEGNDEKNMEALIHVEELGISQRVSFEKDKDRDSFWHGAGSFFIDEAILEHWSPANPKLYKVKAQCMGDTLQDEIGFRRIEVRGREILLNGENIFLKGMCVHEESLENKRAVSEDDMLNTLHTAKELGCNFLRLTHYPHNEQTARLADRLGVMLLEEIPVYWAMEFENPKTFQDASNQLTELILRDKNRASVIIWSVGNENPDTDARYQFMERLADLARSLDQTRLIGASCLIDTELYKIKDRLIQKLDVVGVNEYYGWYIKDYQALEKILANYEVEKPVIITETGADAVCGIYGKADEIYTEECQAEVYKNQFEILLKHSFIRGITPWVLFDYASMRRMSHLQNGYNLKGIIGADRKHRKKAYEVVKAVYKNL